MAKRTARKVDVAKARHGSSRTPLIVAVTVVVLLAAVVIGGVLLSRPSTPAGGQAAPIPVTQAPVSYPTTVAGNAIVAGGTAPHTLDIYEDALCPACKAFEQQGGEQIAHAVTAGRVQVRYHMVNLLEQRSNPPGYSSLAGGALMCAAENNAFPGVHTSLYAAQPQENGTGYTAEQLVALGQSLGAAPGYAECVTSGRYTSVPGANLQAASTDPTIAPGGSFGTPTLVLDGRKVTSDADLAPVLGG